MLIRFIAKGAQGRALGMGLSFGNLDELRRGRPIVFELAPYGSSGHLIIACGDQGTLERVQAADPDGSVITLTPQTLDTLRGGQTVLVPLHELGVPGFAVGFLFAGETEFELITVLRASGMAAPDTPLEGLEEYSRHERNEVEDCPRCRERRHGEATPFSAPMLEREGWRERLYRHPYRVVLAGLAFCGLLALAVESLKSAPPPPQEDTGPPPMSERTRAWIASDQVRRRLLEERTPQVFALGLDEAAKEHVPCTAGIVAPRPLGEQPIGMGRRGSDDLRRFEESMELLFILYEALDVMPGSAAGVGPVRRRLHHDAAVDRGSLSSPYRLTFVVDAWTDPVFTEEIAHARPEEPIELRSDSYTPGAVTGRLWVWSLDERAFVCASPPVTAATPPLILRRRADGSPRGIWDEPLLKARVETVLMGASAAAARLSAVPAGTPGP